MVEVLHLRRKQVLLMEVQITHKPLLHLMGHTEQHLPLWEETQAQLEVTGLTHPLEVPEEVAIQKVMGEVAMVGAGATVATADSRETVTDLEEALTDQLPSLGAMEAVMEVQVEAMEADLAAAEEAAVILAETEEAAVALEVRDVEATVEAASEAVAVALMEELPSLVAMEAAMEVAVVTASCLTTKSMPPAFPLTSLKKTSLNSLAPLVSSRTTKELANPRFGFTNIATQATRKAKPL